MNINRQIYLENHYRVVAQISSCHDAKNVLLVVVMALLSLQTVWQADKRYERLGPPKLYVPYEVIIEHLERFQLR